MRLLALAALALVACAAASDIDDEQAVIAEDCRQAHVTLWLRTWTAGGSPVPCTQAPALRVRWRSASGATGDASRLGCFAEMVAPVVLGSQIWSYDVPPETHAIRAYDSTGRPLGPEAVVFVTQGECRWGDAWRALPVVLP